MKKQRFHSIMLAIIAILLILNLFNGCFSEHLIAEEPTGPVTPQRIGYEGYSPIGGVGGAVTCSQNGQYVYVVSKDAIFRSTQYGRAGTWQKVAE